MLEVAKVLKLTFFSVRSLKSFVPAFSQSFPVTPTFFKILATGTKGGIIPKSGKYFFLPRLNNVIKKYYPILTATERCQEAFKDTPLLAYRRLKYLRDFLIKAKLNQSPPNNANLPKKVTRCNDGRCRTCKFIAHGTSSYTFHNTGEERKILQNLSCSSNNLVYLINCKRCIKKDPTLPCQYIGQTCRTIRERFGEHRRDIENNIDESVPIHLTNPNTLLMASKLSLSYMSTVTEIASVCPWNNILLTKLELSKTASIELVTTKYS